MKSTPEQLGDKLAVAGDSVASVIPGQEKARDNYTDNAPSHAVTHDTGRSGDGGVLDQYVLFVPFTCQARSYLYDTSHYPLAMAKKNQTYPRAASYLQPDKSKTQETRDTITPGHHSETKDEGKGVMEQVGDAIVGAKDAVAGAFGGGHAGQQQARDL